MGVNVQFPSWEGTNMKRHPVLEVIEERWKQGSVPGARGDTFKIALAIEGGAMRGVVSAGMLAGLEYLRLLPAFDAVYGTSAGAINGAYFLAGQAAYGTTVYYENINNSRFINHLRPLRGKPVVSMEYLFEQVMLIDKPLDWRRVMDSAIEFIAVATSAAKATAVLLRGAHSRENLFLKLNASAQIPALTGEPLWIDGESCLDGGFVASIPVRQALQDGATHVLALLTRPLGARRTRSGFLRRYLCSKELAKYPLLSDAYKIARMRYVRDLHWLDAETCAPSVSPCVCAIQMPRDAHPVGTFETRRAHLLDGARNGMRAVLEAFDRPQPLHAYFL